MENSCFGNQLREHAFGMYAKFPKTFSDIDQALACALHKK